ncbi:hypothetical protein EV421DRAFT_1870681 [Armillaria borealis]|uniref:Uncharacterized protein n=1 Tax=Armillaria borealis TaxID=47425 RepID=A0AA39IBR3_9AGAR|nr:hypothetical protein EV421DRAFT_1883376 [Armillaria borealis]KAK0421771.1 hypothetical protein EV421DRAFT_1870681 [Armillaria borealis]
MTLVVRFVNMAVILAVRPGWMDQFWIICSLLRLLPLYPLLLCVFNVSCHSAMSNHVLTLCQVTSLNLIRQYTFDSQMFRLLGR